MAKMGLATPSSFIGHNTKLQYMISNDDIFQPYYLNGYKAIEKEIELLKVRGYSQVFNQDLFNANKTLRELKQDNFISRAKSLFYETLLIKGLCL